MRTTQKTPREIYYTMGEKINEHVLDNPKFGALIEASFTGFILLFLFFCLMGVIGSIKND